MATFGERLRELRIEAKKTQEDLAKTFNVSESAVGMYERNQRTPSQEMTKVIADHFDVTTDYLMGRSDYRTAKDLAEKWNEIFEEGKKVGEQSIKEQSSSYQNGGRAYYGGGSDWTEEEKAAADAFIETLRKRKADRGKK